MSNEGCASVSDAIEDPDIDMAVRQGPDGERFVKKSGEPY